MKINEIRTRRLILRPLKLSDYPVWFDALTNCRPSQNEWDPGPLAEKKCSKKIFKKYVTKLRLLAKKDDYYHLGVFEKKSGKLLGSLDFDIFLRNTHQFANFGYIFNNLHWGKGYGQEAAKAGLKIGFKQLKLNRLEAAINLHNKNSLRLAKGIGMRKEGIKKRYWFENGKWVDHMIYVANPEDLGLCASKPF